MIAAGASWVFFEEYTPDPAAYVFGTPPGLGWTTGQWVCCCTGVLSVLVAIGFCATAAVVQRRPKSHEA
jgi:hypothetical protein